MEKVEELAAEIGGTAIRCDASSEADVAALVAAAVRAVWTHRHCCRRGRAGIVRLDRRKPVPINCSKP
jgi:hypothetical protein